MATTREVLFTKLKRQITESVEDKSIDFAEMMSVIDISIASCLISIAVLADDFSLIQKHLDIHSNMLINGFHMAKEQLENMKEGVVNE